MENTAAILVALTGLLAALGTGISWFYKTLSARFDLIEQNLEKCELRDRLNVEGRTLLLGVVNLLVQELQHIDPSSAVIKQAEELLAAYREIIQREWK
jgi:ABC-type phosphate transport system substrate-binding protein